MILESQNPATPPLAWPQPRIPEMRGTLPLATPKRLVQGLRTFTLNNVHELYNPENSQFNFQLAIGHTNYF